MTLTRRRALQLSTLGVASGSVGCAADDAQTQTICWLTIDNEDSRQRNPTIRILDGDRVEASRSPSIAEQSARYNDWNFVPKHNDRVQGERLKIVVESTTGTRSANLFESEIDTFDVEVDLRDGPSRILVGDGCPDGEYLTDETGTTRRTA